MKNDRAVADFGPRGLTSVTDSASGSRIELSADEWSISVDQRTLRSADVHPTIRKSAGNEVAYEYEMSPWRIQAVYSIQPGWSFVSKQLRIMSAPETTFTVRSMVPWDLKVSTPVQSDFVPSVYVPHLGETLEQSWKSLPGKGYGEFLRFGDGDGAFVTVQNPFLEVRREGQSTTISYAPQMQWQSSWGEFTSDVASIGAYRLTGTRNAREMVKEWHLAPHDSPADGMDKAEVDAFTACVRAFLIHPAPDPISVLVGWTLNDYQIDAGTAEGRAEYKRIIDSAAELGIQTLLYAPGNSQTAVRTHSVDTWGWEYVLWLGMGQQIRRSAWDPAKDPIPASVSEMLAYAKQKRIGLLAYVYPSIPYEKDASWIVQGGPGQDGESFTDPNAKYATLASRSLQDYLIRNLVEFKKRTGIAGYSFDYDFLNVPGSSSYAQWNGWRRVIETLRREFPEIVIDGRQSYQIYGPWSWLAGSYPHPTGTDEQPESFKPYPDLHFDRVSANRMRFVNYWYRNYQFAPEEVIPGYATHQTERSRSLPAADGQAPKAEMMYTRFKTRDWDYLGYRYSFLSSIATAGWNNVVDMIPARDPEEWRHFSAADKAWIREWLNWTVQNKEYLLHARTILEQPALGHVDGTAAVVGDEGFLFLFNPNYKQLPADLSLDESIGLTGGTQYIIKELYPFSGRALGKQQAGVWSRGDRVHLVLDGTSATVLEITPAGHLEQPAVFNAAAVSAGVAPRAELSATSLSLTHVAGEPGTSQTVGVMLPADERVSRVTVNGKTTQFKQTGRYIDAEVHFDGECFGQAQGIALTQAPGGELVGSFEVPQRIFDQLSARKRAWPIPWTREDYDSTWLAPERLLLFAQSADGNDSAVVTATLDDKPVVFKPAYSAGRVEPATFVGFYADLSKISPGVRHTIKVHFSGMESARLQGIFFDNVEPELTESIRP
ncbi:MAG TPA: hypothetical protein VGL00_07385 [Terracidiphilus sp.]